MKTCRQCETPTPLRTETRDHLYVESGLDNVTVRGMTFGVCPNGHEWMSIFAMAKNSSSMTRVWSYAICGPYMKRPPDQ